MKINRKKVLAGMVLLLTVNTAYAGDFFSNTILTNARNNGVNSAPGFDPCAGPRVGDVCVKTTGSLLALDNVGVGALFSSTGHGAVTDNMFGVVERSADLGLCNVGSEVPGQNKLNCGDMRQSPEAQGQTVLPGSNLTTFTASDPSLGDNFCQTEMCESTVFQNAFTQSSSSSLSSQSIEQSVEGMPTSFAMSTNIATTPSSVTANWTQQISSSSGFVQVFGE